MRLKLLACKGISVTYVTLRGRIKEAARILNQLKPSRANYGALTKHQSALSKYDNAVAKCESALTKCESALTIDSQ